MENIFKQLVAMDPVQKDDATGTADGSQQLHGPNGLFNDASVERAVVNAVPQHMGLELPAFPTNQTDPIFQALTGYGDVEGSEPATKCAPGPTPGTLEVGNMMFTLGYKAFSSNTINPDELILRKDRGDTDDMQLLGQMWSQSALVESPGTAASNMDVLNNAFALEMNGIGRAFSRWIADVKWTGDPAGATAGYAEPKGFDLLIATGYIDPVTSLANPVLDSEVLDFGLQDIVTGTNDIYQYMSHMEYVLYEKAERTGLNPVTWQIAMAPQVWHEITRVWPTLAYTENSVVIPTGSANNVDGRSLYEERLRLLRAQQLIINGRVYNVAVDDGIVTDTTTAPGSLDSSIYFIPMTILGGQYPATYWEYLDYRLIGAEIRSPITNKLRFWTDDGRYKWSVDERLGCFTVHAHMQPRLVLRTPQLAGRIDDVRITPMAVLDNPLA
jgi:hypothetical protein